MHPVERKNGSGWPARALVELRNFDGVTCVDRVGVRAGGDPVAHLVAADLAVSAIEALRAFRR